MSGALSAPGRTGGYTWLMTTFTADTEPDRRRARSLFPEAFGPYPTGTHNAITDVTGVMVGHVTLHEGTDIRTGVTAIMAHDQNPYRSRVPAGLCVANGFGKLIGATQVQELGELETPVLLTNTLAAPRAADALIRWTLEQPGNGSVTTVNPFVGETNDSRLNDIRAVSLREPHFLQALSAARGGAVEEGAVGAGTGTVAFGYKGGIGTSSRVVSVHGEHTVGVLVQSNYGGELRFAGRRVPSGEVQAVQQHGAPQGDDGSIMIIIATDAPLSDRNLRRLAARAHAGLARTGSGFSNGSGDYALAFSVAEEVRRSEGSHVMTRELANQELSPLFAAVIDATEEAILNSLTMAVDVEGFRGNVVRALRLQ